MSFLQAIDTQVEVGPTLRADGNLPTPRELFDAMGAYVIGQEDARRTLSVAVYNHYKRTLANWKPADNVEIAKSNIMLLGPTGTGKTLMVQTLARILDVPLVIADATTLTDAGYIGEGVQQALLKLLEGSNALVPPLGGRSNLFQKDTQLDTTNILFICGGAFVGLDDIVRQRVTNRKIGFTAATD